MRTYIIRGLAVLAFLLAAGWVVFDPAWESGITAVVLLAGLISAFLGTPGQQSLPGEVDPPALPGQEAARPKRELETIAVLPFANLSSDPEGDYFSDGITDELINTLGQTRSLRVTARTSAFVFKKSGADAKEIGRRLGVDALLEGTVRRSGDRIRISTQLVDVASGFQLWSARFDRQLDDIFRIQEEISNSVVERLTTGGYAGPGQSRSTESLPAYDAYLQGLALWSLGTAGGWVASTEQFRAAVERDPQFALAHAGLALGNFWIALMEVAPAGEVLPVLRAAAERAIAIDPELFEAILANAVSKAYADWDWRGAEEEFRRAISSNPSGWMAHHQYATFLSNLGRPLEGIRHIELARELDPLNVIPIQTLGWCQYVHGDFQAAADLSRQALQLQPHYAAATIVLGLSLLGLGRIDEAVESLAGPVDQGQGNPFYLSALAFVLGEAGRHDDADARRRELEALGASSYVSPVFRALADVAVGELESAVDNLRTAAGQRSSLLISLPGLRWWDRLRSDQGFSEVMATVGFSDDSPSFNVRAVE